MGLFDVTSSALEVALRGTEQRQTVLSNNLANVNTPGLQALRRLVPGRRSRTRSQSSDGDTSPSTRPRSDDDRHVDLDARRRQQRRRRPRVGEPRQEPAPVRQRDGDRHQAPAHHGQPRSPGLTDGPLRRARRLRLAASRPSGCGWTRSRTTSRTRTPRARPDGGPVSSARRSSSASAARSGGGTGGASFATFGGFQAAASGGGVQVVGIVDRQDARQEGLRPGQSGCRSQRAT